MTRFPHVYVLNVMSHDHPGIVAAVSNAVESLGGNIDACSQTVLGGYFTLIMIVSVPEPIEAEALAERVRGADSAGAPYQVLARPALPAEAPAAATPADRFVVSAFGPDQPGIVRRFSQYLAGKDVNIVDLYGDRSGERLRPDRPGGSAHPLGHSHDAGRPGADGPGTGLYGQTATRERLCSHEPIAAAVWKAG